MLIMVMDIMASTGSILVASKVKQHSRCQSYLCSSNICQITTQLSSLNIIGGGFTGLIVSKDIIGKYQVVQTFDPSAIT